MDNQTTWTIPQEWESAYVNSVIDAISSPNYFAKFRSNEHYNYIVPNNIPVAEAQLLYNEISTHPEIIQKFDIIKLMDSIGSPGLYSPWNTSPRNLKYMYTVLRVMQNFGNDIKSVVEIGVGYGGLCYTMQKYFDLNGYNLVDLDCVKILAKQFLSKLCNREESFYKIDGPYDICVSECAISELDKESIEYYYNKYVLQSKYLFIRTNFRTKQELEWFYNMVDKDYRIEMQPDLPNEIERTALIGWKK